MSAKFIRRLIEVFIAILMIGFAVRVFRLIAGAFGGDFGTVTWPVQAGAVGEHLPLSDGSSIGFVDGVLIAPGQPLAHALDLFAGLASAGIFIAALLVLRNVLIRFAEGQLVVEENTAALRKIGLLLLTICAISVLHVLTLQPMIISAVAMPEGMLLHPSVSWAVSGMTNIWLHYSPPLTTFLLGGLALLFAEAFRAGSEYRTDSESVI